MAYKEQWFIKPLKLYIYPTDTMKETYVLDLNSNGLLSVSMGTRRNDDVKSDNFLEPLISKEKMLDSSEILEVLKFQKDLEATEEFSKELILDDSWEVTICYNNKKYNFDIREHRDESIGILVRQLMKYSPINVDIHGWS